MKLSTTVESYQKEIKLMRKLLKAKDDVNRMLTNKISISDCSLRTAANTSFA